MSDSNYRIKYRKGNFEIEVQGDREWVEAKFKELTTGDIIPTLGPPETPEPPETPLPTSLPEFLSQKGSPSQDTDLVTVFGYWLYHKKDMKSFNRNDLLSCYSDARISQPSNINQTINHLQGNGYLVRLEKEKDTLTAWTITPSGEKYVEQMKQSISQC
jgi:hypothetical protein